MNRSRQFLKQGLALLLVLLFAMPLSALADGKKTNRKKSQSTKTATATKTADQQDTAATDATTSKSDDSKADQKDVVKPSANDDSAPAVVSLKQQTPNTPQSGQTQSTGTTDAQTTGLQPGQRSALQPPEDRVGVNLNNPLNISIHDAVVMALNKNLSIAVQRTSVEMAEYNLKSSQGIYDVNFNSRADFISSTQPSASIFSGATNGSLTSKELDYNAGISQLIPQGGGNYSVQWNNSRVTSSGGNLLNPTFNNSITFNITQPILKNFKIDQNRKTILIAKKNLDLSDIAFKQTAINTINAVQDAYWNLVFAIKNEDIQRDALDLAVVQLDNNKKRVAAGDLAPIDVISAQVQVDQSINGVIGALQSVTNAENALKALLSDDPNNSQFWTARLVTTTPVDFQPLNLNLQDATRLALTNRPELQTLRDNIEINNININYDKDQLKPEIDLIGFYTTRGLAGSTLPVQNVTVNSTDIAFAQELNKFLTGQPGFTPITVPAPITQPAPSSIAQQFVGSQITALSNLFGNSFRSYEFGVAINFPFRNRTAKANLGFALANSRQLDLQQKQQVLSIQVDVRNALQAVESARQSIDAAKSQRVNAEAQLAGEEQKFKAGLSQNFLVLQRQNDLSTARGAELRAMTQYNIAVSDLQRVLSITLDSAGVSIQSPVNMTDAATKPNPKP